MTVRKRCRGCGRSRKAAQSCPHCGSRGVAYQGVYIVHGREKAKAFDRKLDAERWARKEQARVDRGEWHDPDLGRQSLEEFWAEWRAEAEGDGDHAERTLLGYDELMRLYVLKKLGGRRLISIEREEVELVVEGADRVSEWRAADTLKVLRMLLNVAVDRGLIPRNPAARVKLRPIPRKEPQTVSPSEVQMLADAITAEVAEEFPRARSSYRLAVLLGAFTSFRSSESFALREPRLDLMRCRIQVTETVVEYGRLLRGQPKTPESRRWVSVPESIAFEIAEHLRLHGSGPDGLLLTAPRGGPIRRPHFGKAWRAARVAVGLDGFQFKNLRHTGATLLLDEGFDSLVVARRLGHTSTRMIEQHYAGRLRNMDAAMAKSLQALRDAEGEPSDDRQAQATLGEPAPG